MNKHILKYSAAVCLLGFLCTSCTKRIDFNQVNDLQLKPVFESSLVYINEPANRFLVEGTEISTLQDSINLDFFKDDFIVKHLIKAEFLFQTTNSIDRAFRVQVDMFDNANQLQHRFLFSSIDSPSNEDVVTEHLEVFEGNSLVELKNTTKLVFTLFILPGEPINQNTLGRIMLKSKGTFYLSIEP